MLHVKKSRVSWVGTSLAVGAMTALVLNVLPSAAETAPPSVGADVPGTYFGPFPSQSFSDGSQYLVGPQQLLRSGTVNRKKSTTTIPLYLGHSRGGKNVWYILTDTTDRENAAALGLNFSAKLRYAAVGRAARSAWLLKNASLFFSDGAVDFSPVRTLVPGDAPNFFPPKVAKPGQVGDAQYTPYVQIKNEPGQPIYNAPVVAYDVSAAELQKSCKGKVNYGIVHDRVVHICPKAPSNGAGTVTLETTPIFSFAKPASYISTEASDPVVATLDKGTFAPAIGDLPTGRDDSAFSPIERLFVTANGPVGRDNPQRQGLNSALSDTDKKGKPLPPLQVIGGIPNVANDYSPAWDLNLGYWTPEAIRKGYRSRLIDEFQVLDFVQKGFITGPQGKPYGSIGVVVNCPIIERIR